MQQTCERNVSADLCTILEIVQNSCARCRLSGKHSAIGHPHRCSWENTQEPWILQVQRLLFEFNNYMLPCERWSLANPRVRERCRAFARDPAVMR